MNGRVSGNQIKLVLGVLLLCAGCVDDTRMAGNGLSEERTAARDSHSTGLGERHCELILLNASPAPTVDTSTGSSEGTDTVHRSPVVGLGGEPPRVLEYRRLHREIPAAVVQALGNYHIHNYSVHIARIQDEYYAVRYFEYRGRDFTLDMAGLDRDADYRPWRDQCEACQVTMLPLRAEQWWAPLQEIGHVD